MSNLHSVWAVEILRRGEWVRAHSKLHENIDDATRAYRLTKESIGQLKDVTDIRIAEYRGWYFASPYATIP